MANIAKAPSSAPPPPLSHEHARDRQRCQGTIVRPAADLCRNNKRTPSSAPLPTQPASRGWPTKLRHRHPPRRVAAAYKQASDRQRCPGTIVRPAADLCCDNEQAPSSAPLPTQPASWGCPPKLRHRHSPRHSLVAMPASEPCGPPCHQLVLAPASRSPPPRHQLVVGQPCAHQHLHHR